MLQYLFFLMFVFFDFWVEFVELQVQGCYEEVLFKVCSFQVECFDDVGCWGFDYLKGYLYDCFDQLDVVKDVFVNLIVMSLKLWGYVWYCIVLSEIEFDYFEVVVGLIVMLFGERFLKEFIDFVL